MLASAAVLLSSCNCYKKMAKNADDVNITCTPTVLSLKGNTVSADITVTYPAAYFNKKAVLKVTPVLVFEAVKHRYSEVRSGRKGERQLHRYCQKTGRLLHSDRDFPVRFSR